MYIKQAFGIDYRSEALFISQFIHCYRSVCTNILMSAKPFQLGVWHWSSERGSKTLTFSTCHLYLGSQSNTLPYLPSGNLGVEREDQIINVRVREEQEGTRNQLISMSLCICQWKDPWLQVENGLKSQGVGIGSPIVAVCTFHKREPHQQGPVSGEGQSQVMPVLEGHNEDLVFVPGAMRIDWGVTACDLVGGVEVHTLKSSLWLQCGKHWKEARRGPGRSVRLSQQFRWDQGSLDSNGV